MKKNALLTFLFISTLSFYTFSQWEFQNPVPTNAPLNDIQFIDENHGWTVGDYGTILKTSDGGLSWVEQNTSEGFQPGYYTLLSVCFIDLNHGWATGRHGDGYVIAKTSDGGSTWLISTGSEYVFHDVVFTDLDNGYVIATSTEGDGYILHSENGGISWNVKYASVGIILTSLCFADQNNGWAVGENGIILHTLNGGESWENQGGMAIDISSVCFIDLDNGWVAGTSIAGYPETDKIYYTSDGGNSWSIIHEFVATSDIGNVVFTDVDHGFITYQHYYYWCGVAMFSTNDGGNNWNMDWLPLKTRSKASLYFLNQNNGWFIAENAIFSTNNGGGDWESQNTTTNVNFESVIFTDEETGWALGKVSRYCQASGYWNRIFHTNNGGNTWQLEGGGYSYNCSNRPLTSMFFLDSYNGWVSRRGGPEPGNYGKILRTSDGGITWDSFDAVCSTAKSFKDMFFIDTQTGFGCSVYSYGGGGIFLTQDGGHFWDVKIYGGLIRSVNSMHFIKHQFEEYEGWAVGTDINGMAIILHAEHPILISNWELQLYNDFGGLNSVHFVDGENGWAVGDDLTILHTSDGGANWAQQEFTADSGSFSSVYFANQYNGWIVGKLSGEPYFTEGYVILSTINGGEMWELSEYRPYGELNSVQFIDSEKGWAVGAGGTIIHTNNGGITDIQNLQIPCSSVQLNIYPNPSKEDITIEFELPRKSIVEIAIYDLSGKICQNVILEELTSGKHHFVWNTTGQKPGVYFCTLKTNQGVQTKKIIKL